MINKINELLTEGGRHVTIYNKYRGRNEEYVIQIKSIDWMSFYADRKKLKKMA